MGRSTPLGATLRDGGVSFSLYLRHATKVELLFFDHEDDAKPARIFLLDPVKNRTDYGPRSVVVLAALQNAQEGSLSRR